MLGSLLRCPLRLAPGGALHHGANHPSWCLPFLAASIWHALSLTSLCLPVRLPAEAGCGCCLHTQRWLGGCLAS